MNKFYKKEFTKRDQLWHTEGMILSLYSIEAAISMSFSEDLLQLSGSVLTKRLVFKGKHRKEFTKQLFPRPRNELL